MTDSKKAYSSEPIYKILHRLWHTDNKEELFSLLQNNTNLKKPEKNIVDKISNLIADIGSFPTYRMLLETNILSQLNIDLTDTETNKQQVNLFLNDCNNRPLKDQINNLHLFLENNGVTNELYEKILNLSNFIPINNNEEYEDPYSAFQSNYEEKEKEQGINLLVDDFNKKTGGIHPGQLAVILGYAGSLKTTYASNIAFNASKDGFNVLYISLEVPKNEMVANFLGRQSFETEFKTLEVDEIRQRKLSDENKKYLFEKIMPALKGQKGKIYILDETDLTNYSFYALEEKLKGMDQLSTTETGKGLDLVVIDHTQLLKFSNEMKADTNTVLNMYVSFFRQQCINFIHSKRQCSFLILSQANRDGWTYALKHGGMYRLTALADANELERASSIIISVYADEQMKIGNQAKVALLKARNTSTSLEPVDVFTDPSKYAFGDIMEKANTTYSGSMSDILASTTKSTLQTNIDHKANKEIEILEELGLNIDLDEI